MRTTAWLTACLFLACATPPPPKPDPAPAAAPAPAPAPPPKVVVHAPKAPVAIAEYFKIRRVRAAASFSFDDKWVVYPSDEGGRTDLWIQPVPGGPVLLRSDMTLRKLVDTGGQAAKLALYPADG